MGDVSVEDLFVTDVIEVKVVLGVVVKFNMGVVSVRDTVLTVELGIKVVLVVDVKIDTGVVSVEEANEVTGSVVD